MGNSFFIYGLRALLLILIQVLVFNQLVVHEAATPFVYIIAVIGLPFAITHVQTIFVAFIIGFVLDLFSGTGGVHSAASTFLGFLRPSILNIVNPPGGYDDTDSPNIARYGLSWFLSYISIMIFVHHLILIFLDRLSFEYFWSTLGRILGSSLTTLVFVILYSYFFYPRKKN
tara:strand:+ start:86 stop:601 length:516 start_codon:yes stop_codon:yes gene_type:complete